MECIKQMIHLIQMFNFIDILNLMMIKSKIIREKFNTYQDVGKCLKKIVQFI